jgi:hypothetical protein
LGFVSDPTRGRAVAFTVAALQLQDRRRPTAPHPERVPANARLSSRNASSLLGSWPLRLYALPPQTLHDNALLWLRGSSQDASIY